MKEPTQPLLTAPGSYYEHIRVICERKARGDNRFSLKAARLHRTRALQLSDIEKIERSDPGRQGKS